MWLEILLLALLVIAIFWSAHYRTGLKNYPPGPFRFPILGNLPLLGPSPLQTIIKWKNTYGNVVGCRFGSFNVVVISGYSTIKAAYDQACFSGRPALGPILLIAGPSKAGLISSEGPHWSEQRRFALRHLRDFGFGKASMESLISEDVATFVTHLKEREGLPVSTDRMLSLVVLSSLWKIVTGEKLSLGDTRANHLLTSVNRIIASTSMSSPSFFIPWMSHVAPGATGWTRLTTAIAELKVFMRERIAEHEVNDVAEDPPRDFMDVYLNEMQATKDPSSSFYRETGEENMVVGMINLFGAGAEPTANTLNWGLFLLAKNTEVQDKMQEELDAVVGRNRAPSLEDRDKLLYTEAVMLEIFRKSSIVPFGIFHKTLEPVVCGGYDIPKDTVIMANVYDVHHDAKVWGDPENFRPERFLSLDGSRIVKPGPVIPFLIGKRACLGETLGRANFYLVLAGVLQRFRIRFDPDTEIKERVVAATIRFPPTNKVIIEDRFD